MEWRWPPEVAIAEQCTPERLVRLSAQAEMRTIARYLYAVIAFGRSQDSDATLADDAATACDAAEALVKEFARRDRRLRGVQTSASDSEEV